MDKCPKCGAEMKGHWTNGLTCKDRQIAALQEKLADLMAEYILEMEGNRVLAKDLAECKERLEFARAQYKIQTGCLREEIVE